MLRDQKSKIEQKKALNQNSLCYWYPRIKDLQIPQPKTLIYELNDQQKKMLIDCLWEGTPNDFAVLKASLHELGKRLNYPLFLRTDFASGKHDWKDSCFVPNRQNLIAHLLRVVEFNLCADIMGLPFQAIVLREFLELDSSFKAFYGEMPVARERRYFLKDGEVICHHPYWPADAIERGTPAEALPSNWKKQLTRLNKESQGEVRLLTAYAQEVSEVILGYWSIDFAYGKNGTWYLIDMAKGECSWHPEDCKMKEES